MNVSYRWLRSLAPALHGSPRQIADRLAMYGAPVDEIVDLGGPLKDVLVGRVVEVRQHPNADRLTLCKVDTGAGELLSVVCGAPNVRTDRFYPYIPEGGELPGGVRIRRAKIRGEESRGMLCSARELGLGREHEGILELRGSFTPGEPFAEAVQLDDIRFVVEVTPNRPDLLSHIGIARELAPAGDRSLVLSPFTDRDGKAPKLSFMENADSVAVGGVQLTVEDATACPQYLAACIRGVRVGPSPEWLASRLRAVGLRPINNVVDATNFVLYELGQPLHAFDLDTLDGVVRVRQASPGETLVTLDGERRALAPGMLVIADASRPIALAGVMGGASTEVSEDTRSLLLECALFEPAAVRRTRRSLGMVTDASYRFERGVDPEGLERALTRAVDLIQAIAGGEADPRVAAVRAAKPERPTIRLRASRIAQVLGVSIPMAQAKDHLESIGFDIEVDEEGAGRVRVPGPRVYDVFREDDLVEEIARRHGYDVFPDDLRAYRPSAVPPDRLARLEDRLRTLLVGRGFFEARSAAFAPPTEGDVELMLPLSSAESRLRRALLPGLVHKVEANFNRGARDVRLFELGTAFTAGAADGLPIESLRLAAVLTGARTPPHWSDAPAMLDVWDLKGLLEAIAIELELCVEPVAGAVDIALLEPRLSFRLVHDTPAATIGHGGRIRAAAVDSPAWAEAVWGFEIDLTGVAGRSGAGFRPLAAHPAIERDIALLVPTALAAAAIEQTIRGAAGDLLEDVHVFDLYRGQGVPAGMRSVAFRLRFRAPDRTLTDREIDSLMDRLLRRLRDEHDVERRA